MNNIERRFFTTTLTPDEARQAEDGKMIFGGIASSVNEPYTLYEDDTYAFIEVIAPGAFREAAKWDVRVLLNHDPNFILGRTAAGTAKIEERANGLYYEWDNDEAISYAADLARSIKRGDITQSSFAFAMGDFEERYYDEDGKKKVKRTILNFRQIYDVSPVTYPANQNTSVNKRDLEAAFERAAVELYERKQDRKTIIHMGIAINQKAMTI
jgi:HK97 family phage prohead protease